MRRIVLLLALAGALLPWRLEAQANSGQVDGEGCWCGYMTGTPRELVVRGKLSTVAMKQAAADAIAEWNRYATVATLTVDPAESVGTYGNGINEVNVLISEADATSLYGFALDPLTWGVSLARPRANFSGSPTFNDCKYYASTGCGPFSEADVLLNATVENGWTDDWLAFGRDSSSSNPAMVQRIVTHEVGHSLGLHHVFSARGMTSFSVMNYADDDAGKWVTRMDANTLRAEYVNGAVRLTDVGIFPFRYDTGQYAQNYATLGESSVVRGGTLALHRWTLENIGTAAASDVSVRFYAWPAGSRKYPDPADVPLGSVTFASVPVNTHAEYSGTPLTVPAGMEPGKYNVGAIVLVGGAEDSPWVAGKPNNNRFVVGHNPYLTLTVLSEPPPVGVAAYFWYAPASPMAGDVVSFTDGSVGSPTGWSWDFGDPASGDQNASTKQNPTHVFSGPGAFSVKLTATGPRNQDSLTHLVTVAGVPPGITVTRLVPVVLDVGASPRFTSELTLANRGNTPSTLTLRYTAAPSLGATGSGTVTETLEPGLQLIVPDAIAWLRQKGLAIPASGGQGGSLRVTFTNLSSEGAGYAGARTTTPSGDGRCGLSFPGTDVRDAFTGPVVVSGLRQGTADRSNLAVVNAGTTSPITVRVTVSPASGGKGVALADRILQPGEWYQYNSVLTAGPWAEGKAIVERVSGTEPFLAYGVFNDQQTNDGSYVGGIAVSGVKSALGVPSVVESSDYRSELVVASMSDKASSAYLNYIESMAEPKGDTGWVQVDLAPGEQKILPDIIDYLRKEGASIGPKGPLRAGYLRVAFTSLDGETPGLAGARTSSPAATGGEYGAFASGLPMAQAAKEAWVFGLQQGSSVRSNLAITNVGIEGSDLDVWLQVFDGATGQIVSQGMLPTLKPKEWYQKNGVLGTAQNGYCRLTVVEGTDAFLAYGVVNDGADAASGTNDGSYVAMEPVVAP